jgi:hypothetical protein
MHDDEDSLSPLNSPIIRKPPAVARGESFRGLKRLPSIGDLLAVGNETSNNRAMASSSSIPSINNYSPPALGMLRNASSSSQILVDLEDVDVVTPTNLLRMRSKMATTALTQEQIQEMFCGGGGGGGGGKGLNKKPVVSPVEKQKQESPTNDQQLLRSRETSFHDADTTVIQSSPPANVFSPIDRQISREYSRLPDIGSFSTPPHQVIDHDSRNSTNSSYNIQLTHVTVPGSGCNSRPLSATGSLRFSNEKPHLSPPSNNNKLPPVIVNACLSRQRTPDSQRRSTNKGYNNNATTQRSSAVAALLQDDSDDDHSFAMSRRSYSVNDTKGSNKTADDSSVCSVRRKLLAAQQQDHQQRQQQMVEPVVGDTLHK